MEDTESEIDYILPTLSIQILFITLYVLFAFPLNPQAANLERNIYYVSPTGLDTNDGTIGAPWKTIQKAANTLKSGDIVYVRDGIYSEFVRITNSGSKEGGSISFKAFPGEHPIIDGKSLSVSEEKRALLYLKNVHYIVIDGFELKNLSTNDSDKYPAGILVSDSSSHIRLANNHVHHIQNKSPRGNAHGILFYGSSENKMTDIVIESNNIHDLILGSSESLTLSGNIDGFLITKNKIHHNNNIGIDVAGFYEACGWTNCIDQVRNGIISNNMVYNNSSGGNPAYKGGYAAGGIYADGATNILIEKNIVYNNDFGIELASENFGKETSYITVKNNIIYNNNRSGIIIGGASRSNGGASNNVISNNVIKYNDRLNDQFGEITIQSNTFQNKFMNNIIYSDKNKNAIQNEKKEISNLFLHNQIYFDIVRTSISERIVTKKIMTNF